MTTAPPPRATARGPLLVLGLAAALFAAVAHLTLFADGSLNNDEVAYLLQAEAMTEGELFLDVIQPAEAHQPWLFVERPPGFVSKYLPLVSGLFAVGVWATGRVTPVLALLAGLLPLVVAALAREVGLDRRLALVAAALVALSPVVLMESALPLSYLLFLLLVTTAWLLIVRLGHGRAGFGEAVALGLVGAAAAGARPYDAVLLLVPGLIWAAAQRRRLAGSAGPAGPAGGAGRGRLGRLAAGVVLGALPLVVALGLYNWEAAGKPWRLPFGLLEASDTLGFGVRRLYPEQSANHFGPLQGLVGLGLHFALGLLTWVALGLVLVPAAVVAWRRAPSPTRMLLVSSATLLAGYTVFWGPWNFSWVWGTGVRVLGPIYAMPLVVPVVLAGLPVLARWYRGRPRRWTWVLALVGVVTVAQLAFAVQQAAVDAGRTDRVLAAAERARARGPLLVDVDPPYLGHPVSGLVADTALADATPVPVPAAAPGSVAPGAPGAPAPQLLQLPKAVYAFGPLVYAVTRQERVAAPELSLEVSRAGSRSRDVLVVERAGRTTACRLADVGPLRLGPAGVQGCGGAPVPGRWIREVHRRCPDTSCLALAVYRPGDGGRGRRLAWRRLPVETTADQVALLVDGEIMESEGRGWLRVAAV